MLAAVGGIVTVVDASVHVGREKDRQDVSISQVECWELDYRKWLEWKGNSRKRMEKERDDDLPVVV